jgi:cysteine-rich repeat protein
MLTHINFNKRPRIKWPLRWIIIVLLIASLNYGITAKVSLAEQATTTVSVSICGDGIVQPQEACDSGANNGIYSQTIAGRNCNTTCSGFFPYCGDAILQVRFGEECDDGNNGSGDGCSAECKAETIQPGGGGGGAGPFVPGSPAPIPQTEVVISGKAYPASNIHILKDGATIGVVRADNLANFQFSTKDVTPGVATFGIWAEDASQLKSIAYTITVKIVANATTNISGIYLPPTITLDKKTVARGEDITFSGQSIPSADIDLRINSEEEIIQKTKSENDGSWKLLFNTQPLSEDVHRAKTRFETKIDGNVIQSIFSQTVLFFVGQKGESRFKLADLNQDGKVNLADFSIMLFHWGTPNPLADLNGDKTVNLADFSILLFYWTG